MRKISPMFNNPVLISLLLLSPLVLFTLFACSRQEKKAPPPPAPASQVIHPEWSRTANIYEVNIRQYTPEGTFSAFEEHIPRLKKMGVDILWLMPVNPIGEKNRKGTLGSYYSIRDYTAVNPEFGTLDDLKSLVSRAHGQGMYVILDWVANHSSWDNPWITEHPGWYKKDSTGAIISPYDWTDVAQLDYGQKDLWVAMADAMKFWLVEADVDGFRCDVAGMVPLEFWDFVRPELDRIKPVFMLAEAEEPPHHFKAFDMSYAWELHHLMHQIAKGEKNALDLEAYFYKQDTLYPEDAYRMTFTTNHDENSWNGTEYEKFGSGALCFAVLTATLPGMPLIYSGQESANTRRLEFFEKDSIDWKDFSLAPFYNSLLQLKHRNQALWNGTYGGRMERLNTGADSAIFAFYRYREGDQVLVITNLSDRVVKGVLNSKAVRGDYTELFTGNDLVLGRKHELRLKPWEYQVWVKKQ